MLRMRACLGQPGKGDGRELCVRCMWLVATARLDFGSDELEQVLGSTLSAGPSTNTGAVTGEGAHTPKTRAGLFVPIVLENEFPTPVPPNLCDSRLLEEAVKDHLHREAAVLWHQTALECSL